MSAEWIFVGLLGVAAAFDVGKRRIPNLIPILLIAGFVAAALVMEMPPEKWLFRVVDSAAVLILGGLLFSRGLLGGGDVKLLTAGAMWYGIDRLPTFLFVVSLAGALLALAAIIAHAVGGLLPAPILSPRGRRSLRAIELPYAVAIAAGGILVMPIQGA